jgi:hypothetical protein
VQQSARAPRNPWTTLASKTVYTNPWVKVREDEVIRRDGQPGIYSVVEIRPSVGVLAFNEKGEIALVGQWRYTLGRYSWEIVRGGSAELRARRTSLLPPGANSGKKPVTRRGIGRRWGQLMSTTASPTTSSTFLSPVA